MVLKLILMIALEYNLEPGFVQAIALIENPQLNSYAVHYNRNGSIDRGLMQLNNSWYKDEQWYDAERNIRAACAHIAWLRACGLNYWQVAVAYNAGIRGGQYPSDRTLDYARRVMEMWQKLTPTNRAAFGGY